MFASCKKFRCSIMFPILLNFGKIFYYITKKSVGHSPLFNQLTSRTKARRARVHLWGHSPLFNQPTSRAKARRARVHLWGHSPLLNQPTPRAKGRLKRIYLLGHPQLRRFFALRVFISPQVPAKLPHRALLVCR